MIVTSLLCEFLFILLCKLISYPGIFKGPLDSCLSRCIGLELELVLGLGLGFVGQRGVSKGKDSRIKFCEQHLSDSPNN